MYDYIYLFFYKFFEWKNDNEPKDSAIYGIMITIFFHLFFLYTAFSYFTNLNPLAIAFGTDNSKFFWIPLVVVLMFLIHRIFKRRADKILTSENLNKELLTFKNIITVVLLVFGPLFLGIQFLN